MSATRASTNAAAPGGTVTLRHVRRNKGHESISRDSLQNQRLSFKARGVMSVLKSLPSKTIILGVLDLSDPAVERPEEVAARIRRALELVPPERIVVAPDCGMKYLPREVALGKMQAMAAGAAIVRREIENRTGRNEAG